MRYYFFKSIRQGRKMMLSILPGQSHCGLSLDRDIAVDGDGVVSRYPEGTVFVSTSLRGMHKGHAFWFEAKGTKVLSETPVEVFDGPDERMVSKWREFCRDTGS